MRRRTFLGAAAVGLVAVISAGAGVWHRVPVIPKRPEPDAETAIGWISYRDGRFSLTLPRIEMGQNIATALKQIACTELGTDWNTVDIVLHDTSLQHVKATVGSESVQIFAEPLAQACASLRDALASGRIKGPVKVARRPVKDLRAFVPGGLIGSAPEIVHGREIVLGAALFAGDVRRPGTLFGRVLRAPAALEVSSHPLRWDIKAAQTIPGFVDVVEECGPPVGKAHGLGIVASRPGALDIIADALAVEWQIDADHAMSDISQAIDVDARTSAAKLPQTVLDGSPTEGRWDVDIRFDIPLEAHAAIEPRTAVAEWTDGALTVWAGTQDAFYVRDFLANEFGLSSDAVEVHSCRIGGAFGGKTICSVEAEAAALAMALRSPIKVQRTREQEFALGFHRPPSSHRIRSRLQDGRISDWDHEQISSHVLFTAAAVPAWMQKGTDVLAGDGGVARGMAAPYTLGRSRAAYDAIRLPVHTGPWRGLGAGPNGLAIESAIDEAAIAAGTDPLVFRLDHIEDERLAGVLTHVGEIASWGDPAPAISGNRVGRGIACGVYKDASYAAVVANVAVGSKGDVRVTRLWCAHDCGLVINPDQVRAQCEGNLVWSLGSVLLGDLPVEDGRVVAGTFAEAPIPGMRDVPPITVDLIGSQRAPSGAGETAIVAGPGAIANAIRKATGRRPRHFPIRAKELSA